MSGHAIQAAEHPLTAESDGPGRFGRQAVSGGSNTAYAIAYLWAFLFQTLYLLPDALGGGKNPAFEAGEFPWSYGVVTLAIFLVGFAIVSLGHWVRGRRRAAAVA